MSLQPVESVLPRVVTSGDMLKQVAGIEESLDFNPDLPYLAVTHENPDTDAMMSLWFIRTFLADSDDGKFKYRLVPAGTRLPQHEGIGFNVIHVDTGHGRFDHHERPGPATSSFALLAEHYEVDGDAGIKEFVALSKATDNVEKDRIDPCSIHYVFKAMRGTMKLENGKTPDWDCILRHVFIILDSLYSHHAKVADGDELFQQEGSLEEVGGLKLFINIFKTKIKPESAFRGGADIVVWFYKNKGTPFAGVQCKKQDDKATERIRLGAVCGALRLAEAQQRNVNITQEELVRIGNLQNHPTWFIHQSNALVLAGSNTHSLNKHDATSLSPHLIAHIVRVAVANPAMRFSEIVRRARGNSRAERTRNQEKA